MDNMINVTFKSEKVIIWKYALQNSTYLVNTTGNVLVCVEIKHLNSFKGIHLHGSIYVSIKSVII